MFSIIFVLSVLYLTIAAKVQLSDGTSMQYGVASADLQWQSSGISNLPTHRLSQSDFLVLSGILYQGCDSPMNITDCYTLSLSQDPTKNLDPGFPTPRQRIEFRSPNQADGTTVKYTWKHYLQTGVGTTTSFFHLMQIFSTGDGGPVITLDAVSGKIIIKNYFQSCGGAGCPSMDLAKYEGRVTSNTLVVTYGPNGEMSYVVSDASSGNILLSYKVQGYMGTGGS
jgi:hypothetical protein